jgi:hypothetical protein
MKHPYIDNDDDKNHNRGGDDDDDEYIDEYRVDNNHDHG